MQGSEDEEPDYRELLDERLKMRTRERLSSFLRSPMPWRDCDDALIRLDDAVVFERLWCEAVRLRWIVDGSERNHLQFLAFCHRIATSDKYDSPMRVIKGVTRKKEFGVRDPDALVWAREQRSALLADAERQLNARRQEAAHAVH